MIYHLLSILLAITTLQIPNPESWNANELNRYIGQTVHLDVPVVVTALDEGRNSGLQVSPARRFSPTNQARPGSPAYSDMKNHATRGCFYLTDYPKSSTGRRAGEKIKDLTIHVTGIGTAKWVSGTWVGNSRKDLQDGYDEKALRMRGEPSLIVCAMNCEYYLTQGFDPRSTMGPKNEAEHQKQRAKVGKALATIAADIYGLVEIQQGDGAISEIAQDLSKNTGRVYRIVRTGTTASGTYTQSGFLYDTMKVRPVDAMQSVDRIVANRKRLQVFEEKATGERFIYSINHFKAKSGGGTGADSDKGDGQGGYNYSRTQEAIAVLNKYHIFAIQEQDSDMLVMGDLNAYAYEDPIVQFTKAGMYDLHRAFHADSSYSYRYYDGTVGYLDHAIASSTLYPQVTGMTAYHINSDESDSYTYDSSNDQTMFRCSDHDPIIVGLKLNKARSHETGVLVNNREVLLTGADIMIYNAFSEDYPARLRMVTVDGRLLRDEPITENIYRVDRPASAGLYILTIYGGDQQIYEKKVFIK